VTLLPPHAVCCWASALLLGKGAYRPHQLHAADITCSSLASLSVINLRRMWANSGNEHMDLQKQRSQKHDDDDNDDDNKKRRRRVANALL
jgi:hypothetical protein